MVVVAGPSGSGKSIRFNATDFGVDAFNVDDRCSALHGSYQGIPPEVRRQAQEECEQFVDAHIRSKTSFATETTLRTDIAIKQAQMAKDNGFVTSLIYIGTRDVEINIERIRLRALDGGHSAPADMIRDNYIRSLRNLPAALAAFDRGKVYDNSGAEPWLVLEVEAGRLKALHHPLPEWIRGALAGSSLAKELESQD